MSSPSDLSRKAEPRGNTENLHALPALDRAKVGVEFGTGVWTALVGAGLVLVLLIAVDEASTHLGLRGFERILDDVLGAAVAGLLVFVYERRRSRDLRRRLQVISLMNHHVRNALQVISYSGYAPDQQQQLKHIHDAVARIDWALREILPGQQEDET